MYIEYVCDFFIYMEIVDNEILNVTNRFQVNISFGIILGKTVMNDRDLIGSNLFTLPLR